MNRWLIFCAVLLIAVAAWGDVRVNDLTRHDQTQPSVAQHGNVIYVAYQDNADFNFDVRLAVSDDGGMSFGDSVTPYAADLQNQIDPDVAVGPYGEVVVVWADWRNQADYDVYLAVSDDQGDSFSDPVRVTNVHDNTQIKPVTAVDADETIYVAFTDNRRTTAEDRGVRWDVRVAVSDDGGATFAPSVKLNPDDDVFAAYPAIAPLPDGAAVVWFDLSYRIWFSVSHDHGVTWSVPLRLDDNEGAFASMPRVAADDDRIFAVWNDGVQSSAGQDPTLVYGSGKCLDVYAAYSADGGATFTPPFRVNQELLLNQQYPAVTFDGPLATIAWSDDREVGNYTIHGVQQFPGGSWPATGARYDEYPEITLRHLPDLAGPALVWQDYRNGDWDIYFKWLGY